MDLDMADAYEQGRLAKSQGKDRWRDPYIFGGKREFAKQLAWDRRWNEAHDAGLRTLDDAMK